MKVTSSIKVLILSTIFLFVLSLLQPTKGFAQDKQQQKSKMQMEQTSKQSSNDKKSEPQVNKSDKESLVCIVSGEEADPNLKLEYKGKTYYFCCKKCVKKFKDNPEKYIKSGG